VEDIMEVSRSIRAVNNITEKEEKMLRIVMSKYEFDVISFYRLRSVYKVNTTTGNICLKRIRHGRKRVRNGNFITDELRKNNFSNVPKYFKTKDGLLIVKYKKLYFYASEWIDGEECSFNDINEARKCVRLLAEFHQSVNRIDIKKLDIKNNLKNWLKIFSNCLNDIEKFKKVIDRKRISIRMARNSSRGQEKVGSVQCHSRVQR
jgi:CotS family spore coat protein